MFLKVNSTNFNPFTFDLSYPGGLRDKVIPSINLHHYSAGQPCKVNMSGTAQNLAIATQLVQEAMLGVKSQGGNMGHQGGGGGYGGEFHSWTIIM